MSVHEGLKYPCNQCTSEFTRKDNLKEHKKSVHENVKYSCNQCKSKFTQNGELKIHKMSVHENVKYPCDQCVYESTKPAQCPWAGFEKKKCLKGMAHIFRVQFMWQFQNGMFQNPGLRDLVNPIKLS